MIAVGFKVAGWLVFSKTGRYVLAAIAVAIALWWAYSTIWHAGYDAKDTEVKTQNQEAVDAADKGSANSRACRDSGGVWSQATGQCLGRR